MNEAFGSQVVQSHCRAEQIALDQFDAHICQDGNVLDGFGAFRYNGALQRSAKSYNGLHDCTSFGVIPQTSHEIGV
jgi:hypothetical protein